MNTDLGRLLAQAEFQAVIDEVAARVRQDSAEAFADPLVADWLGRRYRNIFLTECEGDPRALRTARVGSPMRLIDGRSRRQQLAKKFFRRLPAEEAVVEMPQAREVHNPDVALVFAPDLMTGLLPVLAFQSVWPQIQARFGIRVIAADSHPVRSSAANSVDLAAAIEQGYGLGPDGLLPSRKRPAVPPEDVVLIGYSKGAVDVLALLRERPDLAPRIRCVVGWGGLFAGSYIADDIYSSFEADDQVPMARQVGKRLRRLVPVVQVDRVGRRLHEYDIAGALADETTAVRKQFWSEHIDEIAGLGIPFLTVSGATVTVVPYFQALGYVQLNSYDPDNDMQITQSQARVPLRSAAHLAMFRAHHWDLAYDPFPWWQTLGSLNVDHKFARLPAMAALVLLLAEIGLLD